MKPASKIMVVTAFWAFNFFIPLAAAKIVLQPDFQGSLLITYPNGEIAMLNPGDPIPDIPSGSSIQVFKGSFSVQTEPGDSVKVACLAHEATAAGGASAGVSCSENAGAIEAKKGTLNLVDPTGKTFSIEEGNSYPIALVAPGEAPPTFGTEPTAFPEDDQEVPVDSRSIDASPR